ncbi:MAG: hypothetical protein Q7S40_09605 [Opitutaceae bacterium]|nr:hypothetical protein [Opitutaceae bacterium]
MSVEKPSPNCSQPTAPVHLNLQIDLGLAVTDPLAGESAPARRTLIHIPVIHTEADMGSLSPAIKERMAQRSGVQQWERNADRIDELWTWIENMIAGWSLPYEKVRIYQDGLPVCAQKLAIVIVQDLAKTGSRNHQLLLHLREKGATIMGTESAELLVREYQFIQSTLNAVQSADKPHLKSDQATLGRELLEQRDQAIADRINRTLGPGEVGLIFLGMLHSPDKWLAADIRVIRTIYPEPPR